MYFRKYRPDFFKFRAPSCGDSGNEQSSAMNRFENVVSLWCFKPRQHSNAKIKLLLEHIEDIFISFSNSFDDD